MIYHGVRIFASLSRSPISRLSTGISLKTRPLLPSWPWLGSVGATILKQDGTARRALQSHQESKSVNDTPPDVSLRDFQHLIRDMYLEKDVARGIDGTFMWLMEEVGELAAALRDGTSQEQAAEFADVLAWLTTIANVAGVDLAAAVGEKYGEGCPGCVLLVCTSKNSEKP